MRQADYIYGIVPGRGEYGFEVQPHQGDPNVLARVQSLASSFQWNATTSPEVVALAVDRSLPVLFACITTDPRDPNGRQSICIHIWIIGPNESLARIIASVWPGTLSLPVSQTEFLSVAQEKTSGRVVVGPDDSFSARGFDTIWGVSGITPSTPKSPTHFNSIARPVSSNVNRTAPTPHPSSTLLKILSLLLAIALIVGAVFVAVQHSEIERLAASAKSLSEEKNDASFKSDQLQKQIDDAAKVIKQKSIELESSTRDSIDLRTELQGLKHRIVELESVVAASPGKVDQAELLLLRMSLRTLKDAVESHILSQGRSLNELKNAIPKSPTTFDGITEKFRESIQGKSKNE